MSKRGFGARRSLYAGLGRCCISPTTTGLPKWGSAMPMFRWHKPATKRLKPESLSRPALIRYLRSAKPSGRPVANAHSANAPTLCLRLSHPNGVTKSTASSGFDHDTAEGWLQQGKADVIALGRKVLANPDLPERVRSGAWARSAPRHPFRRAISRHGSRPISAGNGIRSMLATMSLGLAGCCWPGDGMPQM
jgi:hypothetical protein